MKTLVSRARWILLGLPLLMLGACSVDADGGYAHRSHYYYPYGDRYLRPVPREELRARVIVRPDGRREYVYDRY
jgi:hypothetical protein